MAMNEHDDRALDAFLKREGSLNRLYREIPAEEPPPHLDDAILAAAHRAAHARPRSSAFSRFAQNWRLPLALAATILLSTTLVLMVQDQRDVAPISEMYAPGASAPKPPVTAPAAQAPASPAPQRETAAPPALAEKSVRQAEPPLARPRADMARSAEGHLEATQKPTPAAPEAPVIRAEPAPASAIGRQPEERNVAPAADVLLKKESTGSSRDTRQAKPMMADPAAGARLSGEAEKREVQRVGESAPDDSPESRVAWIRELRQQGREQEARAALQALRQHHPDYPLPKDLREWAAVP